jgi:hypothetical protein
MPRGEECLQKGNNEDEDEEELEDHCGHNTEVVIPGLQHKYSHEQEEQCEANFLVYIEQPVLPMLANFQVHGNGQKAEEDYPSTGEVEENVDHF